MEKETTVPLDHYVTLGRSGLRVSPLCLGAMTFGEDWGWGASEADSKAIIDRYLDLGGNFIDTANLYTKGHSEAIIGDHLGRDSGRRDRVVIATKFFGNLFRGDPNGGGAGRKAMMQQVEHSLRRLKTDYIDLYWMHAWDAHTPIDETLRGLDDLVTSGKVRYVGVSDTPAWKVAQAQTLAELRGWTRFVGLQIEYSLLERTVEGELIPMAQELGLGVTPWSPLKSGVLTGKYRPGNGSDRGPWVDSNLTERNLAVVDELVSWAERLETTPAKLAIAWVQGRPGVTSTILGARRVSQLEENVSALDLELPQDCLDALDAATTPTLPFPCGFLQGTAAFAGNGSTINGTPGVVFPASPEGDHDRY